MHQFLERSHRRPLQVRVVTEPPIPRCWSVNISQTGIGLIGSPPGGVGPVEGETVELELRLPNDEVPLLIRGEVRWRHDAPNREQASTAFGVVFTGFEEDGALRLARYLAGPPVRVAVAYADAATRQLIEAALGDVVQLEFGAENPEVEAILARGDVSALLICGDDEVRALLLAELAAAVTEDNLTFEGRPRDLAARVVFCAMAAPDHLATLFDQKKISRRLVPPLAVESLRAAVMDACAEHALRLEQERMAQELERNLQREKALRAGPAPRPIEAGPGFQSAAMQGVLEQVRLAAPYKVAVLLQGETGTGKEVLARIVHRMSERRDRPFVVQDCGVLSETLLESELFGHVRGAFTGAVSDHPGLFVLGDGGTVFLDEIENTTPALQAKLLRVLETGELRPVGGTQTRRTDVRLVAASNRDLSSDVAAGRFRGDLYFRLNTFTIDVAPLRERREDVVPLARWFVDLFNHQHGKGVMGLSTAAERALLAAPFPGNVRELRNVVERAVLVCPTGALIEPSHLPRAFGARPPAGVTLRDQVARAEREAIAEALARHHGIARRAALELGVDPVTFARRARRLGLELSRGPAGAK
ncbi:MAG: sigma 54-interacting transcriptional regulator [Myxococcaceae bacterium]|nr:sigma 54-interacting transcriptional regulator [Myxococcaceae bacterium]